MSFRRNIGPRRGPSPIFKRRFGLFVNALVNATTTTVQAITMRETGTIYAVKVGMTFTPQNATYADNDSMRVIYAITRTRAGSAVGTALLSNLIQTETIDGFIMGSKEVGFRRGSDASDGALPLSVDNNVNEKYRFRRKTDENDVWNLVMRTAVVNGAARDVLVSGFIEYIVRSR